MTTEQNKQQSLKKHKSLATGLFVLMLMLYIICIYLGINYPAPWIGYVKAFSEAAMVGALADWFAVTALFQYPLGLKIPHTNIIQNSKDSIGDNLGTFVVDNFINAKNIKPYISQLKITDTALDWLLKPKNQELLIKELKKIALSIITQIDDKQATHVIQSQAQQLLDAINLNKAISQVIQYFIDKEEYEELINQLALKIAAVVLEQESNVRNKVKENSHFLIPGFVNNKIAEKLTLGVVNFLEELAANPEHPARQTIKGYIYDLSIALNEDPKWINEVEKLKQDFITGNKLEDYSLQLWQHIKKIILNYLEPDQLTIDQKISQMLHKNILIWKNNKEQIDKIDLWIRKKLYYYLLKNAQTIGTLISTTVEKWDGKELSAKLELEVGKDLQYIRINGTLVGGLVGLIIYTITQFFLPH